jgi:hypothetical protein
MKKPSETAGEVRVFASVDLIGSTALKGKFSSDPGLYDSRKPHWYNSVGSFYERFLSTLNKAGAARSKNKRWELVKGIGDELMLTQVINNHLDAYSLALIFRNALRNFNAAGTELKVKGCIWLAGFPINNAKIPLPTAKGMAITEDYLGPSIDAGFRIAKFATEHKLMVAVDLALLLTHKRASNDLRFGFDGQVTLKGVLDNQAYPLVWIQSVQKNPDETAAGYKPGECEVDTLHKFCGSFIKKKQDTSWLIMPYLKHDHEYQEQAEWHRKIRDEWILTEQKISNGASKNPPARRNRIKLDPDEVSIAVRKIRAK